MPNSDDSDSSSSVSDGSHGNESDLDDLFDDLCRRDDADASAAYAAGPEEQWTFITHSNRSAKMFEGLSKRVLPSNNFELKYNFADSILLCKAKAEVKHSLSAVRRKLRLQPDTKIDAVAAFAGAMPEAFIRKLFDWLKAGQHSPGETLVSFVDIIEFIRCDVVLRVYGVSSSELTTYGISADQLKRYKRVHEAMKAADMPAAQRHALAVSRSNDNEYATAAAGPAAETFDPIMEEVLDAINLEWAKNFFVLGKSWIDVDDDKLGNCSPKFQAFGFKRTPTKDKKLKPVNHVAATVGTGNSFGTFHNDVHPTVPPCCRELDELRRARKRSRSSSSSDAHSSPKTVTRQRHSLPSPSSPRGEISARLRERSKRLTSPSRSSPSRSSSSPNKQRRTVEMLNKSSERRDRVRMRGQQSSNVSPSPYPNNRSKQTRRRKSAAKPNSPPKVSKGSVWKSIFPSWS